MVYNDMLLLQYVDTIMHEPDAYALKRENLYVT